MEIAGDRKSVMGGSQGQHSKQAQVVTQGKPARSVLLVSEKEVIPSSRYSEGDTLTNVKVSYRG